MSIQLFFAGNGQSGVNMGVMKSFLRRSLLLVYIVGSVHNGLILYHGASWWKFTGKSTAFSPFSPPIQTLHSSMATNLNETTIWLDYICWFPIMFSRQRQLWYNKSFGSFGSTWCQLPVSYYICIAGAQNTSANVRLISRNHFVPIL